MKRLFSILIPVVFCNVQAHCQEETPRGLLNLVNLIPGKIPCEVSLNGKEMLPGGMKSGAETGWFSLPAGQLDISVKSGDSPLASDSMELKAAAGSVIAIYLEPNARLKPDGKPFPPKIKLRSFRTYEAGIYGLRIVSLCPAEKTFGVGPVKTLLKPFQPIKAKTWAGAAFEVTFGGKVIGKIDASPQRANYYVFVAPGNDGTYFAAKANADQLQSRQNQKQQTE